MDRSLILAAALAAAGPAAFPPSARAAEASLPLAGRVTILSSCNSASGMLLHGEGVVGLTRAFFEAGARCVVASLWPVRDDEAAALAKALYDHLGRGESVGAALAAAQRERMRAGAPLSEWASLVVLGDGDIVPFPGGLSTPTPSSSTIALAVGTAFAAAALLVVLLAHRRVAN